MKNGHFIFLFLFIPLLLNASDSIITRKIKVLPVPAFGYSPETKTYIGAVTLFAVNLYDDAETRSSNVKLELNYSWNKQLIFDSEWNYFFRKELWFTKGRIHYSKYPDFYYGIGEDTPDRNKLVYSSNRFVFELQGLKSIGKKLFTGLNIKYISYQNIHYDNQNLFFSELRDNQTVGFGYELVKDSRNNLLTPTNGFYIYLNAGYNFSRENYPEATFDLRYYITWMKKYTLATRLLNEFIFGSPPFYDLSIMGGDENVRGYYFGRYRDNHLTTIQTEFRFPVIWRFGIAVFGGISDIYSAENKFGLTNTNFNAGTGIRFLIDKKENTSLRLDYAVGKEGNNGFYIAFGESF